MSFFTRTSHVRLYLTAGMVGIFLIVLAVFLWIFCGPGPLSFAGGHRVALADAKGANPTGVPVEMAKADLIARGEYLTRAADCAPCHTAPGGKPFAGGFPFHLPFGTIYSANITSDKEYGIGDWSAADFLNALHKGVDDEGVHLYPAMPFVSYTAMTDADGLAIKAYLFSLAPVHEAAPISVVSFPFNQRWLIGLWSWMFNSDTRFEPNADRSAQWNRGAYLAEALGHCGECHTPRNLAYAVDNRRKFAGATTAGWRAYNITSDPHAGIGGWSAAELAQYLATGHAQGRGTASGPMGEAVDHSLAYMTQSDIAALVAYVQTVPAIASPDLPSPKAEPAPTSHRQGVAASLDPRGKQVFEGSCASCHGWTGVSPLASFATLTGSRAVNDPSATNVAQIVILGTSRETQNGKVTMPAFGSALSNVEIAAVANYVTARFGAKASALTEGDVAALREQGAR